MSVFMKRNRVCGDRNQLPPIGTALNDMSWKSIRHISDEGLAANYFKVGDRKAVKLNGTVGNISFSDETYYVYIIGINHNSAIEGANRIHFQFGYSDLSDGTNLAFVDSSYNSGKTSGKWFNMNNVDSNVGGWESSRMRTIICPEFKETLPYDLQNVLKTVTKYTDNVGGGTTAGSNVTATTDTIFLLSLYEVTGVQDTSQYADQNSAEFEYQDHYEFFTDYSESKKYKHNAQTTTAVWWLRNPSIRYDNYFSGINTSGSGSVYRPYRGYGFAPAFCV